MNAEQVLTKLIEELNKENAGRDGEYAFRIHPLKLGGVNSSLIFRIVTDSKTFQQVILAKTQAIVEDPERWRTRLRKAALRIRRKKKDYEQEDND